MSIRDSREIREYLAKIPQEGVLAEIGVAEGDFAALILEVCQPKRLLLVDPWMPYGDPLEPRSKLSAEDHERAYHRVLKRFRRAPEVQVWRRSSLHAAATARKQCLAFDFVYIDADHRHDYVRADLEAWSGLLAPGGMIGGHDYTSCRADIGVIRAVDEFCRVAPFDLAHVTRETWPSFLLRRSCPTNS